MTSTTRLGVPEASAASFRRPRRRTLTTVVTAAALLLGTAACGSEDAAETPTLRIAAIPDQDPERLARTYDLVSTYLSDALGLEVEYVPVTDYAASVTLFRTGDLDLVWYGAVTGVQARLVTPGAMVIAQRDIDAEFRSVFVANVDAGIEPFDTVDGLVALRGTRFTFGSESSTSSRMMPQFFLGEAGVTLEEFDGEVGFAGSHDAVLAVVEAGSYETGTLAEAVWESRLAEGAVDGERVMRLFTTPPYGNYHWLLHPSAPERFGDDIEDRVRAALMALSPEDEVQAEILSLFEAGSFIPAEASFYDTTEAIGRELGVITD